MKDYTESLNKIQCALASESVPFGKKANIAIDLLEVALENLATLGLLSGVEVEISAYTEADTHIIQKYSLGERESDGGKVVAYIKKSKLEEDE